MEMFTARVSSLLMRSPKGCAWISIHSIKVTGIHPGLVDTEFSMVRFKGDENKAEQVYKGMTPLKGEDIADIMLYVLQAPAHVVLADITVFPTAQGECNTGETKCLTITSAAVKNITCNFFHHRGQGKA